MTHRMNVHGPACSEVFSGRPYFSAPTTDEASREDWPALSALVARYGHGPGGLPPSVVLPWYLQFPGQGRRIAGQTGGRMGERHNALLLHGDLASADFEIEGLRLTGDVPIERIHGRRDLLGRLDHRRALAPGEALHESHCRNVYTLLERRAGESSISDASRAPFAKSTDSRRSARACCWPAG